MGRRDSSALVGSNENSNASLSVNQRAPVERQTVRRCRIALYSHDTMGLGHMRRNLLVAQALSESDLKPTILLIAGTRELQVNPLPPDVDFVILPSYHKDIDGSYYSRRLDVSTAELAQLREQTIRSALHSFRPDVFIVDNVARGALGELESTLSELKQRGHTRCVLGLRDIQDDAEIARTLYKQSEQAMRDYYDAIWVYGDSAVHDLAKECDFLPEIREKTHYVGYLNQTKRNTLTPHASGEDELTGLGLPSGPLALCLLGGGQDGADLAQAFVEAEMPADYNAVLVTGPHMPAESRHQVHQAAADKPYLRVLEFIPDSTHLIELADKIITMGGYNSVCEVLSFNKPALIVPRIHPRKEQLRRAQRLQEMGLVDMLHPDQVTSKAISNWIMRDDAQPPEIDGKIDFSGITFLQEFIKSIARS